MKGSTRSSRGESNAEIGLKLGDLITRSLHWWQSHLGDKDSIGLGRWRVESIEVKEIPPLEVRASKLELGFFFA